MKRKNSIKSITEISLGAALLSISAWISIGGVVPVTMQTFTLALVLLLLGGRRGSMVTLLYLAIGAVGLPVYSGLRGGVGHLFSEGGGFLFGFLFFSLAYMIVTEIFSDTARVKIAALATGVILLYSCGIIWYTRYTPASSLMPLLMATVLPYLPFDAVKLTLAFFVSKRLEKYVK